MVDSEIVIENCKEKKNLSIKKGNNNNENINMLIDGEKGENSKSSYQKVLTSDSDLEDADKSAGDGGKKKNPFQSVVENMVIPFFRFGRKYFHFFTRFIRKNPRAIKR
jgi:hypothetical protein